MNPFRFDVATDTRAVLSLLSSGGARCMRIEPDRLDEGAGAVRPDALVDINRLPLADIVLGSDEVLRLGALVRNADTAENPLVRERYPLLRAAILTGASPQIRNMATNGGNYL